jgi:hypothetical protein
MRERLQEAVNAEEEGAIAAEEVLRVARGEEAMMVEAPMVEAPLSVEEKMPVLSMVLPQAPAQQGRLTGEIMSLTTTRQTRLTPPIRNSLSSSIIALPD